MKCIIPLISLLFISNTLAGPWIYEERGYKFEAKKVEECENLGSSNPLLGECQRYFSNIELNALNNSYSKLYHKLSRDKKLLKEAQEKWEAYINSQCHFEAQASKAYNKPEHEYHNIFTKCINKFRTDRASYLKAIDSDCDACVK